ncbi:uncharacterized protein PGTG_22304 [Puccinia graminis f. sp. tritici CRL 75-36-700-3]|uniref:Trehalose 6-phosphate phosphatase n=1 Tax=Puccinia graminis f. sp. tritici (strain CRL 75-36-700-3 / race SCCL) TaxID=418459 RepID=H6QU21_PUCGT|nr:uncharacterized protein PGTG_22304 [Puccinia graminis f. sp. tritici CRL 75-36-700-3]EHS64433.1 hypothetical protein PGTG_22304 [Puccinia graminis f. sp. tritici CRL 75-36-700-3]
MRCLLLVALALVSLVPTFDATPVADLPEADLHFESFAKSYQNSQHRIGLFDNDGCLKSTGKPISKQEADAQLQKARALLTKATQVPNSDVWVITARNEESIKPYLDIPGLNFGVEQGTVIIRANGEKEVLIKVPQVDEIKMKIAAMIRQSAIKKDSNDPDAEEPIRFLPMENSIPLKFHDWDSTSSQDMRHGIEQFIGKHYTDFTITSFAKDKVMIIHNPTINKRTLVEKVLKEKPYDFGFSVGDDIIDEGMHDALNAININQNFFSVVVSRKSDQQTVARHKLSTHEDVYRFFTALYSLPTKVSPQRLLNQG